MRSAWGGNFPIAKSSLSSAPEVMTIFPFLESKNLFPTRKGGRTMRMVETALVIFFIRLVNFFSVQK